MEYFGAVVTDLHIEEYERVRGMYARHARREREFDEHALIAGRMGARGDRDLYMNLSRVHRDIANRLRPMVIGMARDWFGVDVEESSDYMLPSAWTCSVGFEGCTASRPCAPCQVSV